MTSRWSGSRVRGEWQYLDGTQSQKDDQESELFASQEESLRKGQGEIKADVNAPLVSRRSHVGALSAGHLGT